MRTEIKYQLTVSLAGLALVVALTFFPPTSANPVAWRKPVVGAVFCSFCALGVVAVFSPTQCGKIVRITNKKSPTNMDDPNSHDTNPTLKGHHPDCGKYNAHVLRLNNKTVCSACLGLLVGGVLALVVSVVYFFVEIQLTKNSSSLVFAGVLATTLGLFQYKFGSVARFLANIIFVLGAVSVLVGIDSLIGSLIFDLVVICLIVFWLFTRISLSGYDHEVICGGCDTPNCRLRA
ncbi:MAG: hypothetical protein NWF03_01465 [Candidatus Bathyarchaeota archaeon]|nr:hypothetical protein [Candidatus Bathyarchaeota archaeon]